MIRTIKILLILLLLFCAGCGKEVEVQERVSMYDLRTAMEGADKSLPEMLNASSVEEDAEDKFSYVSDMPYDKVEDFFVSYAAEGGLADEIVVIAVRDADDVQEAKESLEAHRQDRYKLLEQYEPKEVRRVKDGIIFCEERYAVLIICDHADEVRKAFEDFIKKE